MKDKLTLDTLMVALCTTKFNIRKFYILPTQCIHMCYMYIRTKKMIISLYSINCLIFITGTLYGKNWIFFVIEVNITL